MKISRPAFAQSRIDQGTVVVGKGGTGGRTPQQAVANLGGIYIPDLDRANSVAKLMADGTINPDQLPSVYVRGPTLNGPLELYPGQVATYVITNFDANTDYAESLTFGTVRRVLDTLTIVAPSFATTTTLTINGRELPIIVREPWPVKPTLAASTSGTTTSATGIFTGSAFAMVTGSATHRRTDWEIAYDVDFTNVFITSDNDHSNLTGWEAQNLAFSTTYYARCRYEANNGMLSEWSDIVQFSTLANYVADSEEAKLVASDRAANDNFGWAVAMDRDGTRVAIGSPQNDETWSSNNGGVYIFKRTGTTWAQEAKLIRSAFLVNNIYTGQSVAIDSTGTRVVAGSYGITSQQGNVYVWVRSGTTWTMEATLTMSDAANNDRLGWSIDCDSTCTWLAVGAPQRRISGSAKAGSVCFWQRSGTTWTFISRINATDFGSNDYFGWSVALSGDGTRCVVGAYLEDPSSVSAAGSAYVFLRSGTTWTQEAKLTAADKTANYQFGYSVSMNYSGSRLVVGSNQATVSVYLNAGACYVFDRVGTAWAQTERLTAFDRTSSDGFGTSVDMNSAGDKIIVGAATADPGGVTTAGCAYVFTKVKGLWTLDARISASDKAASDNFGNGVAISGEGGRAIVGANAEDPAAVNNAGSAYVYS